MKVREEERGERGTPTWIVCISNNPGGCPNLDEMYFEQSRWVSQFESNNPGGCPNLNPI